MPPTDNELMQSYCRAIETAQARDRAHLETRIAELEKLVNAKFHATQMAVDKADETLLARLDNVNEFREQLRDQATTFVTRDIVAAMEKDTDRRLTLLGDRIGSLENHRAEIGGKMVGWSAAIGAVVLVITVVLNLLAFGR